VIISLSGHGQGLQIGQKRPVFMKIEKQAGLDFIGCFHEKETNIEWSVFSKKIFCCKKRFSIDFPVLSAIFLL
jgi:hypothetical protein